VTVLFRVGFDQGPYAVDGPEENTYPEDREIHTAHLSAKVFQRRRYGAIVKPSQPKIA